MSPHCSAFVQRMDLDFNVDPSEFQDRKRRRISTMNTNPPPGPKVAPTSAPGVHEVATFLPGRLEFEHELDNEAEDLVKDLEFGACLQYGGDEIVEDENDLEVKARVRWEEEVKMRESVASKGSHPTKRLPNGLLNGLPNGFLHNGSTPKRDVQPKTEDKSVDGNDGDPEEPVQPPPIENENSLAFKLTLLEMYQQRVDRRHEGKAIMFDRGLLNYKQVRPPHIPVHTSSSLVVLDPSQRTETIKRRERLGIEASALCKNDDCGRLRGTLR